MCLAHSRYTGYNLNNKMGVEVSWQLVKQVCSGLSSHSEFIGTLCKFICRQLEEEHRDFLLKACDVNPYIRDPTATKQMYDAVQVLHPKTLSA